MNIQTLQGMLLEEECSEGKPALKLYTDSVGKLTIGVGRNLSDGGISETEALFMLGNDMAKASLELDKQIPWWKNVDEIRQLVLCDMCFNMGWGNNIHGLSSFPNFLEAVRTGHYEDAAKHGLDSHWAQQVGRRATRLMKMMSTGQFQKYT